MNCRDFHEVVSSLARMEEAPAGLLEEAKAHQTGCEACRSLYERHVELSDVLRLLAASHAPASAPRRVERQLMDEFARQAAISRGAKAGVLEMPASGPVRHNPWKWAAIGAAAAAVVILTALGLQSRATQAPEVQAPAARLQPAPGSRRMPVETAKANETARGELTQTSEEAPLRVSTANAGAAALTPAPARRASRPETLESRFVPLSAPLSAEDLEGGTIVRIKLSRSGLASLGVPVVDGGGEKITADVLIGYDGMAKAIRFVK